MNIQTNFDVGQNVYRIYERAVECGYITKYSIELSPDCTIDSKKFKKVITANFTDIQGRMHGPSTFTLMGNGLPDGMYKSKEDAEKALIKKYYSHLFKADVLNNL